MKPLSSLYQGFNFNVDRYMTSQYMNDSFLSNCVEFLTYKMSIKYFKECGGAWLAQLKESVTLDLKVLSFEPVGAEIT